MAGAPVSDYLHERLLHHVLRSDATTYTPYGATEALPVSSITGQEILTETALDTQKGRGYCLGKILSGIDLKIIQVHDHPIRSLDHVKILPVGEIGEIIVKGPNVSASYFDLNSRTEWHKIHEEPRRKQGLFWHRMGDLGYLDENGRLWFCGRMNHRVETGKQRLLTVCCEAIFNQHPAVDRSALVGIGPDRYRQTPVMIIESRKEMVSASRKEIQRRRNELLRLGRENALTRVIQEILFHPELPVDIRHNAKIHREELTRWAAKKRRSNQ